MFLRQTDLCGGLTRGERGLRIARHQEALNRAHTELENLLREKIELLEARVKELEGNESSFAAKN
jgi:hypothetical protein